MRPQPAPVGAVRDTGRERRAKNSAGSIDRLTEAYIEAPNKAPTEASTDEEGALDVQRGGVGTKRATMRREGALSFRLASKLPPSL